MPSAPTPARRLAAVALALATALAAPAARAGGPPAAPRALRAGLGLGRHRRRLPLPRRPARPPARRQPHLPDRHHLRRHGEAERRLAAARGEAGPLLGGLDGAAAVGQQGPVRPVRGRRVRPLLPPDRRQPAEGRRAGHRRPAGLGGEPRLGTSTPGASTTRQIPAYLGCWRHAAAALKQGGPAIRVEFNSARVTRNPEFKTLDLYPGDDVVDGWSLQYYDNAPAKSTQALWDKFYNLTYQGDLWGLGTWLAAARAHGKKLGVAEWGVWQSPARRPRRRTTRCSSTTCTASSATTRPTSPTRPTSTPTWPTAPRAVPRGRHADPLPERGRGLRPRLERRPGRAEAVSRPHASAALTSALAALASSASPWLRLQRRR